MRVPLSWLGEYVDRLDRVSAEAIEAAFVSVGLEVESVHRLGDGLTGPLVVGEVREITELTGYKKPIRFCRVDVDPPGGGSTESRGIVCGAANFAVGDWVVVALPGAVLPGGFSISARNTYGHLSEGMICSARELGVGDDHAGILVLPRLGLPLSVTPGTDAIELLGLHDLVIELAVTPDRGYCLSVRGLARELAGALDLPFHDPGHADVPAPTVESPHPVQVTDPRGCNRFHARAVRGVDPAAATPLWMRRRLLLAGMRSISLIVDVTNYLMLQLGQPMHAFDWARLTGPMVVRRAQPGERLRTLDGVDRELDPEDLLITDGTGPIGLAAVMGGAATEVTDATTDVLIECAHWDPVSVARTVRRHKLPSEASKRFERGVDPQMAPVAAELAVRLLVEYGGAVADPRALDIGRPAEAAPITLPASMPARVVGVDFTRPFIEARLRRVGCEVDASESDTFSVTPPTWRPDLSDPVDLVEEVARLAGYDTVPSVLPTGPASPGLSDHQRRRRAVARALAEAGYVEVLNYPFVSSAVHDTFGLVADDPRRMACRLANPLAETEPELRTSLLPGLLKALTRNLGRGQRDVAIFEMGLVYHPDAHVRPAHRLRVDRAPTDTELENLLATVPRQPRHVAAVLTGARDPAGWWGENRSVCWADAVEAARLVGDCARIEVRPRQAEYAPWHPGRCAELVVETPEGEQVVGHAGELHPRVLASLDLPARVCAMELDFSALPDGERPTAPTISPFPPVLLDVALLVDVSVPAESVRAALADGGGPLLESLRQFDLYAGPQLAAGQKSLAFALTFRASDRTLTSQEATKARDAAIRSANLCTGAVQRV